MSNGLFGLKIFKGNTREALPKYKNPADNSKSYYTSELTLLEICKMLDETGVIKRLEKYKKAANLLGAKIKASAYKLGYLIDDDSAYGFAKQSSNFYTNLNNKTIEFGSLYTKALNKRMESGGKFEKVKEQDY